MHIVPMPLLSLAHLQSFECSGEAVECTVSVLGSMQGHMLAATPRMVYAKPLAKLPRAGQCVHGFLTAMARAAAATLVSLFGDAVTVAS